MEEGLDVCLVEDACALSLWEDEVEEETKADPGVEGNPVDVRAYSMELEGMRTRRG